MNPKGAHKQDGDRRALPGYMDPIPTETAVAIGEALYGPDWVSPLARVLGVNRSTTQRWKDGVTRVTPRLAGELDALLKAHQAHVAGLRRALAPFLDKPEG